MKVDEWQKFLELEVEEILELVTNEAKGQDLIWAGAIGFGGYGFVFRDPFRSRVPFITIQGSSKFCSVGLLLKRNLF